MVPVSEVFEVLAGDFGPQIESQGVPGIVVVKVRLIGYGVCLS